MADRLPSRDRPQVTAVIPKFPIITHALLIAFFVLTVAMAAERHDGWTILPRSEAEKMRQPCTRPFPEGLAEWWRPSEAEVERAEKKLPAAIDAAFARLLHAEDRRRRPERYYRQYAGFLRNGKRVLYVNGLWDETAGNDSLRSRTTYGGMCDGGTYFFGAVYDLEKDAFDSFFFNGRYEGQVPGGGW